MELPVTSKYVLCEKIFGDELFADKEILEDVENSEEEYSALASMIYDLLGSELRYYFRTFLQNIKI